MPDEWEILHRLDPFLPSDKNFDLSSSYTNIEMFVNGLVAKSEDASNSPVSITQNCLTSSPSDTPFVRCVIRCCRNVAGSRRILRFKSTINFQTHFDCPQWVSTFCVNRGLNPSSVLVCNYFQGSSNVDLELDDLAAQSHLADASAGRVILGDLIAVTDLSTPGSTPIVIVSGGVQVEVIVGAVIGALVLITLILILVVLVRKKERSVDFYIPLKEQSINSTRR